MRIDLRYPIAVAAFIAPTPILKLIFWAWGADVGDPSVAAIFSFLFGGAAFAGVIAALFGYDSDPIWWPKGSDK